MGTVLTAVLITIILSSTVTMTSVQRDYENLLSHYLEDAVHGYGALMSEFVDEFGEDVYTNEEVVDTLKIFVFMI